MQKRTNPLALKNDIPSRPLTRRVSPFDERARSVEEVAQPTPAPEVPVDIPAAVEPAPASEPELAAVSEPTETDPLAAPSTPYGWQFVAPRAAEPVEEKPFVEDIVADEVVEDEVIEDDIMVIKDDVVSDVPSEPEPSLDDLLAPAPMTQELEMESLPALADEPEPAEPTDDYVLPDMPDEPSDALPDAPSKGLFDDLTDGRADEVDEPASVDDVATAYDDTPVYDDEPAPMPPVVDTEEDEPQTEEPDPVSYAAGEDVSEQEEYDEPVDPRAVATDDEMTVADYKLAARFSLCGNISRKMKTVKVSSDVGRLAQLMHPNESLSTIVENALLSRIYVENRDAFDALAEMIEKKGGHIKC